MPRLPFSDMVSRLVAAGSRTKDVTVLVTLAVPDEVLPGYSTSLGECFALMAETAFYIQPLPSKHGRSPGEGPFACVH